MQRQAHTSVIGNMKTRVCYWNKQSEHQNNKKAREKLLQKIVRPQFTGTHCKEGKIKNKKNRTTKSAELITLARIFTIMREYYVPNFIWLKQALSILRGVCISRLSV
jgi:hypothetical protein